MVIPASPPAGPKPPTTFEQQADMMLARGMVGDRATIVERLRHVNYYRLLGYSHPFRLYGDPNDRFVPGLHFDTVWDDYVFDQKLRILMMEAIERIEVAVRTQIAYHHSHAFGPDGYATDPRSLPRLRHGHNAFIGKIRDKLLEARSQAYIRNFEVKRARGGPWPPPWPEIWVACETMSFGNIVVMYQGCRDKERELVATALGVTSGVLESWLLALQLVRNICAHHSRLWNRALTKSPAHPGVKYHPDWYSPVNLGTEKRMFGTLSATACLLKAISPASKWTQRVKALIAEHSGIPLPEMGFIRRWDESPIWA